jgi:hypothetical protein
LKCDGLFIDYLGIKYISHSMTIVVLDQAAAYSCRAVNFKVQTSCELQPCSASCLSVWWIPAGIRPLMGDKRSRTPEIHGPSKLHVHVLPIVALSKALFLPCGPVWRDGSGNLPDFCHISNLNCDLTTVYSRVIGVIELRELMGIFIPAGDGFKNY